MKLELACAGRRDFVRARFVALRSMIARDGAELALRSSPRSATTALVARVQRPRLPAPEIDAETQKKIISAFATLKTVSICDLKQTSATIALVI